MKRILSLGLISAVLLSACSKAGAPSGAGGRINSWTIPHVLAHDVLPRKNPRR